MNSEWNERSAPHGCCLAAAAIEIARGAQTFYLDGRFSKRTRIGQSQVVKLANADAFGSLNCNRRTAMWKT